MVNSYSVLQKPFFVLAPMDDVTDTVFRQVVGQCAAPDLYVTEFVNVDGLQSPGRDKVAKRLRISAAEKPVVAQLWGLKPENFRQTAQEIVDGVFGDFAGVDLNMGCPEKTVVKNGACAALMQNRDLALEIIEATRAGLAGKLSLSVKTRLGFNEIDFSWHEFLLKQDLDLLAIHGRTRKEMSKVPANWEAIGQIRELRDKLSPRTLVVGNGDVMSREQGSSLCTQYGLDGVMIGRGVFQDPFVFSPDSPWEQYSKEQRINLYAKHIKLFRDTWQNNERPVNTLNKFCKIYINGFDGAKELRERFMGATSTDELQTLVSASSSS
jgi:tRNA-dihydrouridine synthase